MNVNIQGQHLGVDLLGHGDKKTSIPFQFENGFIIIDVMFNRFLPQRYIVDTGAEHTILFDKEVTDILQIPYERELSILGSDMSMQMSAHICRRIPLGISEKSIVYRDILVLNEDYLHIRQTNGIDVDGIIGGDFFRGLVVELDFKKGKINLFHPDKYTPSKEMSHHDITIKEHKPYFLTSFLSSDPAQKDTIKLNMLIDSGAAITFMLFVNSDPIIALPEKTIPGYLGQGLGGELLGLIGKVRYLGIDEYQFEQTITYFQAIDSLVVDINEVDRSGIIGNLVLSRFEKVAVDYTYSKLYLKPSKNYNEAFEYDKSGLNIFAIGPNLDQYFIQSIIVGSPADNAGILPGDIITRIGCWSTKWYSLESISNKLSGKVGKKIKLTIKRDEEKIKKQFILKDLFNE